MSDPANTFLTEQELERRWGRKRGYCAEQRAQGRGPQFVRLSPRVVAYRVSDVVAFEQRHTYQSSAAAAAAGDDDPPPEAA